MGTWYPLWQALSLRWKGERAVCVLHPEPVWSFGVCGAICGGGKVASSGVGKGPRRSGRRVSIGIRPWRQVRRTLPFHLRII